MAYDDNYPDPCERLDLDTEEALLAELLGDYILHREAGVTNIYPDLLARAQEYGDRAAINFENVVVYWELKRLEGQA